MSYRRGDLAVVPVIAALAVIYAFGIIGGRSSETTWVSYDLYASFLPDAIYFRQAVERGYGLLWNRLQNCGQPFLAVPHVAVLYPLNALFLVFDVNTAVLLVLTLHLAIGGVGASLLARQLGTDPIAALCAGIAFELGGISLALAALLPTVVLGPYVWIPWALLATERALSTGALSAGLQLALALALALLAGHPQMAFYTYQLIALRVVWELLTARPPQAMRCLGVIALGLILPVGLAAVQLMPAMELGFASIRGQGLEGNQLLLGTLKWATFRAIVAGREIFFGNPLLPLVTMLAALALVPAATRRRALFYALIAALYLALVFDNPLRTLYWQLPGVRMFRDPSRFLWITGAAVSVLVGCGAQVVTRRAAGRTAARVWLLVAPIAVALAIALAGAPPLAGWERAALAGLAAVGAAAAWGECTRRVARVALPCVLAASLLPIGLKPLVPALRGESVFYQQSAAHAFVRERLSLQERIYQLTAGDDYALSAKSSSIFGIPSITDYQPLTSMRYASLLVRALYDRAMQSYFTAFTFFLGTVPGNRPLLNLLAARYLVFGKIPPAQLALMRERFPLRWEGDGARVFENPTALPRAFYVPQVEVVRDPAALLERLASPTHDPRQAALVEEEPPDGFVGAPGGGSGVVEMVADEAETLTLRVRATAEGFLSLTDQLYPGWQARVNDVERPILRANYAFRAVRVPAGESTVTFTYRPASVRVGALVSAATSVVMVALALYARRSHAVGGAQ